MIKRKQEETMKYLLGMVCAFSVMSCVTTRIIDKYTVSVTDSRENQNIVMQDFYLYYGPVGISVNLTNSANKPVRLLLSESVIKHDNVDDGLYLPKDPDSIFLNPANVSLESGQIYRLESYPRSLSEVIGWYSSGNPNIRKKIIRGPFSLVLYYQYADEEKQSLTVDFTPNETL
jgi:hypothetical protein